MKNSKLNILLWVSTAALLLIVALLFGVTSNHDFPSGGRDEFTRFDYAVELGLVLMVVTIFVQCTLTSIVAYLRKMYPTVLAFSFFAAYWAWEIVGIIMWYIRNGF